MTLLNSGTTKKYSENWSKAFGAAPATATTKSTTKAAKKASAAGGTKKKKAPGKKAGKR